MHIVTCFNEHVNNLTAMLFSINLLILLRVPIWVLTKLSLTAMRLICGSQALNFISFDIPY